MKTKHFTKSPRIRFDLEKLQDPIIAEVLQAKVGGEFTALCVLGSDIDTLANSLKEGLPSRAEEIQRKKIQPWITNKVLICVTRDVR